MHKMHTTLKKIWKVPLLRLNRVYASKKSVQYFVHFVHSVHYGFQFVHFVHLLCITSAFFLAKMHCTFRGL
jgi:hypothetical protein